ncbi:TfuA-like protein [Micromonospora sp. M12]
MTDIVFIGPSLPADEVARLLPDAVVLPPVAHGDLLRLDVAPGDRVLVIDGFFLQHPPVRHREILDLLDRGVTVAGAASMGALRAAELWPFGMRGVGEVFQLYRDGVVTGDDEVAVVHGPAEEGHRSFSVPLVNIRWRCAAPSWPACSATPRPCCCWTSAGTCPSGGGPTGR